MFWFQSPVQLDRLSETSKLTFYTHTAYKLFQLPRDTTLIKGTSREDQCVFSTSFRLQFDGYSRKLICGTTRTLRTKIILVSTDAIQQCLLYVKNAAGFRPHFRSNSTTVYKECKPWILNKTCTTCCNRLK